MARITFSPLLVAASGKVADTVFSRWKGRPYIRSRVTPANPNSAAQQLQRNSLTYAVLQWQSLPADVKARWNEYASPYSKSGFNFWCHFNVPSEVHADDLELKMTPPNKDVDGPTDFAAATGSGAGEIDCTWTTGKEGAGIYIEAYAFLEGTVYYQTAPEQLSHETVLASVHSATITCGTPGGIYQVVGFITDTNLSADLMSQSYFDLNIAAHA